MNLDKWLDCSCKVELPKIVSDLVDTFLSFQSTINLFVFCCFFFFCLYDYILRSRKSCSNQPGDGKTNKNKEWKDFTFSNPINTSVLAQLKTYFYNSSDPLLDLRIHVDNLDDPQSRHRDDRC